MKDKKVLEYSQYRQGLLIELKFAFCSLRRYYPEQVQRIPNKFDLSLTALRQVLFIIVVQNKSARTSLPRFDKSRTDLLNKLLFYQLKHNPASH